MNISVASYSFHGLHERGMIDVFGYLETVKYRYDLQAADIWNGMLASTDEDYLKKVRQAMDEKELVLANLCVDGAHLWEENPEARERNYQNALVHLKAAEILGAQTIRIDMGGQSSEMTDEQFDYTVRRYQEYCRRAGDNGYKVGTENHWGCSRVPQNLEKLFAAVDHPAFGLLLHLENWESDVEAGDRFAAKYAMHTHFAAWVVPRYEDKINMLNDAGYKGYISVEHHSGSNEYREAAWQLANVRRIIGAKQ